jgi:hypothetical protein
MKRLKERIKKRILKSSTAYSVIPTTQMIDIIEDEFDIYERRNKRTPRDYWDCE